MEENEETELSPVLQRVLNIFCYFFAAFYWLNLFGFLSLFFGIIFPNFGKSDFGHYLRFAIILVIIEQGADVSPIKRLLSTAQTSS